MALTSAESCYRPEAVDPNFSDPRLVPDVEGGGVRGKTPGNGTKISEGAQTGRLEGDVRATPIENYDRVSRGEQNTLRRSNCIVGEGNPIVNNQEVMLLIRTGRPEGETEILREGRSAEQSSQKGEISEQEEISERSSQMREILEQSSQMREGPGRGACRWINGRVNLTYH
jgi:hypothetical protein